MAILYFPLFAALCLLLILLRRRVRLARTLYWVLLVLSLVPYVLHIRYTWLYITHSSFDGPEGGTAVYPGLLAFALSGVAFAALLLGLSIVLHRRLVPWTALLPALMGFVYWNVVLRLLYWRGPVYLSIDNMPLIWLFAWSVFSTTLLLLSGWWALVRPRAFHGRDGDGLLSAQ